jgi:hypothetical protein
MTSKAAALLAGLYPRCWRVHYGKEFAALLEQHPLSLKTLANVLWSAGEAHMQAAISHEHNQGIVVGSIWSAWMIAIVAGLIVCGMVDDSPLPAAMGQSLIFATSWKVIQAGCVLAASAILIAALPLASSIGIYLARERRRGVYLRVAIPFLSGLALVTWMASVLIATGGHWGASPWAVAFSRPDWPSEYVRWTTGSISAALLLLACFSSAASISKLVRGCQLPDVRISLPGIEVQVKPLSFASALSPWAAGGIFTMLAGVVVWGYSAIRVSPIVIRCAIGPLACLVSLPGFSARSSSVSLPLSLREQHGAADRLRMFINLPFG